MFPLSLAGCQQTPMVGCCFEFVGLLLILLIIILWLGCKHTKNFLWVWRPGLPPGRLGWPLLGETLDFVSCGISASPEMFMNKRRLLYGKVFKSHLLGSPTIVCIDAEVSKIILQNDGKLFVPSYPKSLNELMGTSSILMLSGNIQRRLHGLIANFLKSPELKHFVTQEFCEYISRTEARWKQHQVVYLQEEVKSVSFQMLVKLLMNLEAGDAMESLRKEYVQFAAGFVSLPLKFPGTTLYKALQAKGRMMKIVKVTLDKKKTTTMQDKAQLQQQRARDVMELLLLSSEDGFSDDLITDNIIDLMIPGEDSVPMLITLAVKYLSDCPSALQQLREENLKMKKSKQEKQQRMQWSDYMSMPFTQNVITETLRLGTIITGVMRRALHDVEIKGHLIPKEWCVFIYLRSIHLDHELYQSPYEFNPWRWQEKDGTGSGFIPFGGGQRLCPGLEISRLQASIFLHHFVTHFRWEADEDVVVNFPTVRMKNGLPVRLQRIVGEHN